jgi:hypothetical protein
LLKNVKVAAAVEGGQAKAAQRAEITKDEAVKIMAGLLRTKGKRVSARDKVAVAARLAAMLDWDAAKKIEMNAEQAREKLARAMGKKPEDLPRADTIH